ncbi:hypothetical protein EDB87DRAFT_1629725 [Lactarius vividus]|nr:hypothetical protein EDB87DRAFT_1629725 [Lactarius vividus]
MCPIYIGTMWSAMLSLAGSNSKLHEALTALGDASDTLFSRTRGNLEDPALPSICPLREPDHQSHTMKRHP